MTLQTELDRLNRDLSIALSYGGHYRDSLAGEAPIRIHAGGIDDGHGLGGRRFSPAFERWLSDSGVCMCEPKADKNEIMVFRHYCSRRDDGRVRRRSDLDRPNRVSRALRSVRSLDPRAFDIAYLIVARGMSGPLVRDRLDVSRRSRGGEVYTDEEWGVALVAALSLMLSSLSIR